MLRYAVAATVAIVIVFILTAFQPTTLPLKLELACTPAQWDAGLSGRASLDQKAGMLFVLSPEKDWGFWMKGMRFPLDIYWLDSSGKITAKESLRPCVTLLTYPEQTVCPTYTHSAKYVLETNVGALGWSAGRQLNTRSFPVC